MLDATELAKLLVEFLSPALPFLLKVGKKVSEDVGTDAVKTMGKTSWDRAKRVWAKLVPQIQQREAAKQAVNEVVQRPDEISQIALVSQIRSILENNPELAGELFTLWQQNEAEQGHAVDRPTIQTGGVSIGGSFNNPGGTFVGGNQTNLGNNK